MDIDAAFLPVADELINRVFPTPIVYHRHAPPVYDPLTGAVTEAITDYSINAGILSRSRVEQGSATSGSGSGEIFELLLWVEHKTLPVIPTTDDLLTYDGKCWKVTEVTPTYSSKQLIASKITARAS